MEVNTRKFSPALDVVFTFSVQKSSTPISDFIRKSKIFLKKFKRDTISEVVIQQLQQGES